MIPPLDINIMYFHQFVKDHVSSRTPVENVTYQMEFVDGKRLDKLAEGFNKAVCNAGIKNSRDYLVVIVFLDHIIGDIQKLVKDVHHVLRDTLAHPGTRIFSRHRLAD